MESEETVLDLSSASNSEGYIIVLSADMKRRVAVRVGSNQPYAPLMMAEANCHHQR